MGDKYNVVVTIEKEIELTFPDGFLSEQYLAGWKEYMDSTADMDDIIKCAAYLVAAGHADYSNDGFGRMINARYGTIPDQQTEKNTIRYEESYTDYDYVIIKD